MIAANVSGQSVRWSDDGKQSLFVTNDTSASATATLNLWTASTGTVRALTAASTGLVQNFATFVAGAITIEVMQGTTKVVSITSNDTTYRSGKFGFFNYSQEAVRYEFFSISPIQLINFVRARRRRRTPTPAARRTPAASARRPGRTRSARRFRCAPRSAPRSRRNKV